MTTVLELHNVTVRRAEKNIIDDVTWQVKDNERWIVLGHNGAGKTTLIQLASARMHPTQGTTTILGEQLGSVDVFELRPRIGLATAALAEHIPTEETVIDAVLTAAYGVTGRWREEYDDLDTERAHDLMAAFHVDHLAQRTFGTLSEGERKRTLIARSLMADPELLLLDEPAAGLDVAGREELIAALSELAAHELSPVLILVTHHVEEIPPGFTHLLLLKDGHIHAAGPLEDTLTSENLTQAFGTPLTVTRTGNRYTAVATSGQRKNGHHA